MKFEKLRTILELKKSVEAVIVSGSMEPLIKTGAKIKIQWIDDFSNLHRFDVLVFWDGNKLVCHYLLHRNRVMTENNEDVFTMRGLRSKGDDLPVAQSKILGKVDVIIPWHIKLRETWKLMNFRK
jgi:hypothetical protein